MLKNVYKHLEVTYGLATSGCRRHPNFAQHDECRTATDNDRAPLRLSPFIHPPPNKSDKPLLFITPKTQGEGVVCLFFPIGQKVLPYGAVFPAPSCSGLDGDGYP